MMDFLTAPVQLFFDFYLDDHGPADYLLRRVDRFLDLERTYQPRPFYSAIG